MKLTKTTLLAGTWQGELHGAGASAPDLVVTHLGEQLDSPEVTLVGKVWQIRVSIPADRIADGVQTFVITDASTGKTLNSFSIMAGDLVDDNIRAEVELLRAELDMLKKAFRRHCVETS